MARTRRRRGRGGGRAADRASGGARRSGKSGDKASASAGGGAKRAELAEVADRVGAAAGAGSRGPVAALLIALLLGAALLAHSGAIANNDYGLHLRIGEEIADEGPPRIDRHSHTAPGTEYPDHEWLIQLAFYGVHRVGGDGGMVVLRALLIGIVLALVLFGARGELSVRLACVGVVFLLGLNHGQMRPHLVGWVLAALLAFLIEPGGRWAGSYSELGGAKARRRLWAVPPLLLVWGNCHGSVLLGVGMAGLLFLELYREAPSRRLLLWGALCFLAPMVNPQGPRIYALFFEISGHTSFIGEWQAYPPGSWPFWLLCGVAVVAAAGWLGSRPRNRVDLVRLIVLLVLAFRSSRNGVVAAIFLAPMLVRWYSPRVARRGRSLRYGLAAAAVVVAVAVATVRTGDGRVLRFGLDPQQLPVASVDFVLRHRLTGPVFNDYNFGGYLLWKAYPSLPVFVDGRTEVYKGEVLDQYLAVSRAAPGWRAIVDRYRIQFFLIRPEREIAHQLVTDPGWDLVYFDYNSVVFVRHGRFPGVKRLQVVTPYGHRDRTRIDQAIDEISYLLAENPAFFGGYKILAFLLYRRGDVAGARRQLERYLELHPSGRELHETRSLIEGLRRRGAWD